MFAAVAIRTMAGAKQIVQDDGIEGRRFERRNKLVEACRRWRAQQAEREAERERAIAARAESIQRNSPGILIPPTKRDEIIAQVAAWYGFTHGDLVGKSRTRAIVEARFDAIVAVYDNCTVQGRKMTTTEIGRVFGGRDHTSVIHAFRKRGILAHSGEPS